MSDQAKFGENKGDADSTQPQPIPTDRSRSVTDAVIDDLVLRREHGIGKYGVELKTFNVRDAMLDAYQESLDTTVYLKQCLMERATRQPVGYAVYHVATGRFSHFAVTRPNSGWENSADWRVEPVYPAREIYGL